MGQRDRADQRWGIYVRISRFDGDGESLGSQRQERDCRAEIKRRGGTVAGVYRDDDRSAWTGARRPDYERLCADLKAGVVNGVMVWDTDRLIRRPIELEDFIPLIDATGVPVVSVSGGDYDLETADGRFKARIMGAVAAKESDDKSRRLRRKHAEIVESGRPNGGQRPYGYDNDRVTPRPAEAAIVAEVVGRIAAGETLGRIVNDLNERKVPTMRPGSRWRVGTIRQWALNARLIGRRTHNGVDVGEACWPAIVDEATWRRANAIIVARQGNDQVQKRSARRYLLTGGLIVCGKCGGWLRSQSRYEGGHSRPMYQCQTKRRGGCGGVAVRVHDVELLVTEAVIRRIESGEFAKALRRRDAGDHRGVAADVRALEERLDQLADAFAAKSITMREWQRAREGLDSRLDAARARLSGDVTTAAVGRYAGRRGSLREAWPDMSLDARQAAVRAVVDHVLVAPVVRGGKPMFDPRRVSIVWRA